MNWSAPAERKFVTLFGLTAMLQAVFFLCLAVGILRQPVTLETQGLRSLVLVGGTAFLLGTLGLWAAMRRAARQLQARLDRLALAAERLADGDVRAHIVPEGDGAIRQATEGLCRIQIAQQEWTGVLEAMADGDLTHRVFPLSDADLFGKAFAALLSSLQTRLKIVFTGVQTLVIASDQIQQVTEQMGRRTAEAAAAYPEIIKQHRAPTRERAALTELLTGPQTAFAEMEAALRTLLTRQARIAGQGTWQQQRSSTAQRLLDELKTTLGEIAETCPPVPGEGTADREIFAFASRLESSEETAQTVLEKLDALNHSASLLALDTAIAGARGGEQGHVFVTLANALWKLSAQATSAIQSCEQFLCAATERQETAFCRAEAANRQADAYRSTLANIAAPLETTLPATVDALEETLSQIALSAAAFSGDTAEGEAVSEQLCEASLAAQESLRQAENLLAAATTNTADIPGLEIGLNFQAAALQELTAATSDIAYLAAELYQQVQAFALVPEETRRMPLAA